MLWVDDEINRLQPHIQFLEEKGYQVNPCTNGPDALELIKKQAFDVVLLDENMPGMDGLSVLSEIKQILPNLAVIMITKSEAETLNGGSHWLKNSRLPHQARQSQSDFIVSEKKLGSLAFGH